MSRNSAEARPPWPSRLAAALAAVGLIVGAWMAYRNTFEAPFVFDDIPSIVRNPTIRDLGAIGAVLSPPADGRTVTARPVVNLSFAVNYAMGGASVVGYHVLNLAIHALAGLTLFGIARRTLARRIAESLRSTALAAAIALLWTLHPLQTEAVTYTVQRAESLMGLFYLLTLYCFIRGAPGPSPGGAVPAAGPAPTGRAGLWLGLPVAACLLGMASKEVMVSAPLIVLLYDRTFLAGSCGEALRRRRAYFAFLAGTWAVLAVCVASGAGTRGGSVGYGIGIVWWRYVAIEAAVIIHYLRLCLWPSPLVFDYGAEVSVPTAQIAVCAAMVILLLAGSWIALKRRPALGFLGASFFVILAPTSSVLPLPWQVIAEHRMYLPLAAVAACAVCSGYAAVERLEPGRRRAAVRIYFTLLFGVAAGFGWMTARRNAVYGSALSLWSDTLAKRPMSARANLAMGITLENAGRLSEAADYYERTLRITPDDAEVRNNLGHALTRIPGRLPEALAQFELALRLQPGLAEAHNNLGVALLGSGRTAEAIVQFEKAVERRPDFPEAEDNLGSALAGAGQLPRALSILEGLVRRHPDIAEARNNYGLALAQSGRLSDGAEQCREALRLDPDYADAERNLEAILRVLRPRDLPDQQAQF